MNPQLWKSYMHIYIYIEIIGEDYMDPSLRYCRHWEGQGRFVKPQQCFEANMSRNMLCSRWCNSDYKG